MLRNRRWEMPRGSLLIEGKAVFKCMKPGLSSSKYLLNHQEALNHSTVCFKVDRAGKYLSGPLSYGHLSRDSLIIS